MFLSKAPSTKNLPMSAYALQPSPSSHPTEALRLEAVTTCVGFDDLLDFTIGTNHPHLDTLIVVTSHDDKKTQQVCLKHGVICVPTDLFQKNGRSFNKGAAINAGFGHFQYHGWRLHLDVDIALPDNFKRVLFNHTHLEQDCLYGADRQDIIGQAEFNAWRQASLRMPQALYRSGISASHGGAVHQKTPSASSARFVDRLHGYCPIGFFQLWHASRQAGYPYSLGTAAHDDVLFACLWPEAKRRLLPSVVCYHLCAEPPYYGQNWDGIRRQPRF
jgi:hypothetical protein